MFPDLLLKQNSHLTNCNFNFPKYLRLAKYKLKIAQRNKFKAEIYLTKNIIAI